MKNKIKIIALDLEGTLISSESTRIPRPGLFEFLTWCYSNFERVVIFTAVREKTVREIANELINLKQVPKRFRNIEYIIWEGDEKDLNFIPNVHPTEVIIVDDYEYLIKPMQKTQWVGIKCFDPLLNIKEGEFQIIDNELERVKNKLKDLIN